jgi:hypothetical protein
MLTLLYSRHPVVAITICITSPGRLNPIDCFDLLKARQLRMFPNNPTYPSAFRLRPA